MKHFKIYFDLYYRSLCIYATHLLNDTNLVEDVVMECYIGLWIKLKGGAQISEVKNYLFISVRNACYDVNRRSKMIANFVNTDQIEDMRPLQNLTPSSIILVFDHYWLTRSQYFLFLGCICPISSHILPLFERIRHNYPWSSI